MSPDDPVTVWLNQLKSGVRDAVSPLMERYFQQLVGLAERRLRVATRRVSDGEDVALSAFASFCRAAEDGRLPQLLDRDSLWSHLFRYTVRKACDRNEWAYAKKRGDGRVVNASALDAPDGQSFLTAVLCEGPTPDDAVAFEEGFRELLARLPPDLRAVAEWKFAGLTNDEIAANLGRDCRTVERKLSLIRGRWKSEGDE
jgi:DNA-directed RNA polymerase specialized sigma24 family protein